MRTPDRFKLDETEVARLTELARRIDHIQGWLAPREAWELHEIARLAAERRRGDALVVEIGSWCGRSTVAIALGLKAGGGGRLISIDPHADSEARFQAVHENARRHGVESLVEIVRDYSQNCRHLAGDGTADLVFIDGNHDYPAVSRDLDMWGPVARDGGQVALNDPYWPGVRRTIAERIAVRGSPYRTPRFVVNTLICDRRPVASWTAADEALIGPLRSALRFIRPWRFIDATLKRRWPEHRATHRFSLWGGTVLKRRYPLIDIAHYQWVLGDRRG